jgi:hypothetical protein
MVLHMLHVPHVLQIARIIDMNQINRIHLNMKDAHGSHACTAPRARCRA